MKLTDGERSVWAATYAASRQAAFDVGPPRSDSDVGKWERDCVCTAIEEAWFAVEYMREAESAIEQDWGGDVLHALREMLGGERGDGAP